MGIEPHICDNPGVGSYASGISVNSRTQVLLGRHNLEGLANFNYRVLSPGKHKYPRHRCLGWLVSSFTSIRILPTQTLTCTSLQKKNSNIVIFNVYILILLKRTVFPFFSFVKFYRHPKTLFNEIY